MTTLLIIGAGTDQVPAYERAHALGIQTVAIDYDPNAPAFSIAQYHYVVSTKDIEEVVDTAKKVAETIGLNGVMTIGAEVSPTVAAVAASLNLPGVSPEVALLTTNKCARAKRFMDAGVRFPNFSIVNQDNQQHALTYPLVIKPSDNSASRGVRIIENDNELSQTLPEALKLSSDGSVILEEFIPGDQISIEGVVVENTLYVTAIADRNYSRNPYFYPLMVEDGGEMPTRHSQTIINKMCDGFAQAVKALSIHTGPTKGDLIISENGDVYIIEVTSRLSGGGFCSRVVPRVNGINIVDATIQLAVGRPVDTSLLKPKFSKGMCHRYYFHQPGKIKSITGFDTLKDKEGVVEVVVNQPFNIGQELAPTSYANRLFYLITIAESRAQAIELANNAMDSVTIEVES
ncbi:MAG: ATP-grasp domain-containing protein [Agarilytica sp.]